MRSPSRVETVGPRPACASTNSTINWLSPPSEGLAASRPARRRDARWAPASASQRVGFTSPRVAPRTTAAFARDQVPRGPGISTARSALDPVLQRLIDRRAAVPFHTLPVRGVCQVLASERARKENAKHARTKDAKSGGGNRLAPPTPPSRTSLTSFGSSRRDQCRNVDTPHFLAGSWNNAAAGSPAWAAPSPRMRPPARRSPCSRNSTVIGCSPPAIAISRFLRQACSPSLSTTAARRCTGGPVVRRCRPEHPVAGICTYFAGGGVPLAGLGSHAEPGARPIAPG